MKWDRYFMSVAELSAGMSKDTTQVGCTIVRNRVILGTGYNGLPKGVSDLICRMVRPEKYMWTSHAEENAIAFAARNGHSTQLCDLYTTHYPCSRCARMIIQSGIVGVIVGSGVTKMDPREFEVAETMFREAGINVRKISMADGILCGDGGSVQDPLLHGRETGGVREHPASD